MGKNCCSGKPCGNTCINQSYTCRLTGGGGGGGGGAYIPNCRRGKHCGRTCIRNGTKCRDEKAFFGSVQDSSGAQHWLSKHDAGESHIRDGYPAPRNTCVEAQTNLTTDIITLEEKDNPSQTDCKIAKYFCNPGRRGRFGGSRAAYKAVFDKCG